MVIKLEKNGKKKRLSPEKIIKEVKSGKTVKKLEQMITFLPVTIVKKNR